jgi:hypothetical protein
LTYIIEFLLISVRSLYEKANRLRSSVPETGPSVACPDLRRFT